MNEISPFERLHEAITSRDPAVIGTTIDQVAAPDILPAPQEAAV